MKIGIATSGDFISNFLINEINLAFPDDEIIILIDENVGKVNSDFLEKTIFLDHGLTEHFIYPMIESSNMKPKKYLTYNQLSKQKNIKLFRFVNINTQEKLIKKINPDVIISIKFRTIFKENIIKIPKYGIFNIHSGILPQYRGVCCLLRAINNNDKEFGCSLHKISDSNIDTGDIVNISKMKINKNLSYERNYIKMFYLIFPKVINLIKEIKNNKKIITTKQDCNIAKYYTFPNNNEIEQFFNSMLEKKVYNESDIKFILNKYI